MENQATEGQNAAGAPKTNPAQPLEPRMGEHDQDQSACPEDNVIPLVKLAEDLEVQKALAKENFDKYVRVTAELDNQRKRLDRERSELLRYGNEKLLTELLPVVDSFHKAVLTHEAAHGSTEAKDFAQGVALILKQFTEVLERNGLKEISAKGGPFDPNFHQAIQKIECDKTEAEVVHEEFVKGYLLHDRLLRPAMVSVKVPMASKET
jgi:molecular chaperone GrpE